MRLSFKQGILSGLPICFGYFSVSFAFGIFAVESGMTVLQALLLSMTNVTSAGQLAAVPIITMGGSLFELAGSQLIINLRYALMSVTMSQKLDKRFGLLDKLLVAFVNTDEVFAVASMQKDKLPRRFMYGLILTPYIGWSLGTLLGAAAGNVFPESVMSALGIAIYAMFVAIVVPEIKENGATAVCVLIAVILSCLFAFLPIGDMIPNGFVMIVCSVIAAAVMAVVSPIQEKQEVADREL